jgi:hypothetical protein
MEFEAAIPEKKYASNCMPNRDMFASKTAQ